MSFLLLPFSLLFSLAPLSLSTTFTFINSCPYPIWPGILSNPNSLPLSSTGFLLNSAETSVIQAPSTWAGRMWARTDCTTDATGTFSCITGDCGSHVVDCNGAGAVPPATLVEFTLSGNAGLDFYDVSLVDGYNMPMVVSPQGSTCASTGCAVDLNTICPEALKVVNGNTVVACKSACEAFGSPEFCCSGDFGSPNTCGPSDYSRIFKNACPRSYSYAYDDLTSTFTCPTGVADYTIAFCPTISSLKSLSKNLQGSKVPLINCTMPISSGALGWNPNPMLFVSLFVLVTVLLHFFISAF